MEILSHGHNQPEQSNAPSRDAGETARRLMDFQLGRFLLENRGLNGFWTSYIVRHPHEGRLSRMSSDGSQMSELESFILDKCPIVLATQERFRIFQRLTQGLLRSSMSLASIPCGIMDDLRSLNFSGLSDISITGVDLDGESLTHAERMVISIPPEATVRFEKMDAWRLPDEQRWDLISSNGLNIYVQDDAHCTELYRRFSGSLRNNGFLVMSFITPPTEWKPISIDDLERQKFIFSEVIQAKWQCLRSEDKTRNQLSEAGFEVVEIEYDTQRMFPCVVARKK